MILAEISIVIISIAGAYGIKVLLGGAKYKINKKKLKKSLRKSFDLMDVESIKRAIVSLADFDSKHCSHKLEKYLLQIIQVFRDDEEKPTLNEKNVLNLPKEFIFDSIFDNDVEEDERQLDVIEEKLEETKEVLTEVEKRRKEIMLRKNLIRQRQMGKSAKRRSSGTLG